MSIAVHTTGRLRAPIGHSSVKGFVDNVEAIFALAERSDGFVWRFVSDADSEAVKERQAYSGDQRLVVTLSVWKTLEQLKHYTYSTLHGKFYERRTEWFEASDDATMVLWQVEVDEKPSLAEAKKRLKHLVSNGPSSYAFDMKDAGAFV